jgi:radical SAM superfamily enzyme YgiQ (UPF0313 family)
MDVFFINTPYKDFQKNLVSLGNSTKNQPLDLAYCAAVLEKNGFQVGILDANLFSLSFEEIVSEVWKVNPHIVVINTAAIDRWECPLPTVEETSKLASFVKKNLKNVVIILIGPHGTTSPEWTLKRIGAADLLIRGEPEITLLETTKVIFKREPIGNIAGLSYKENGRIKNNPDRPFIDNLNLLPFPAYHHLPMEKYGPMENFNGEGYQGEKWPFSIMITSRGCPASCIYCFKKMYQEKLPYRSRSAEKVVDEIELLLKKYKIKAIYFHDLNFCLDNKRVKKICDQILEKNLRFSWGCETRFDNVELTLLQSMKKAGCQFINFGLESGSQAVLDRAQKGTKIVQMEKAVADCHQAGILVGCFKLLGLPGETLKTFRSTLDFMLRNKISIPYLFPIVVPLPYPGTNLNCEAERQFKTSINWENAPLYAGRIGTDFFAKNSYYNLQRIVFGYKLKEKQRRSIFFIPNKHYLRLTLLSIWEKLRGKNFLNNGAISFLAPKKQR